MVAYRVGMEWWTVGVGSYYCSNITRWSRNGLRNIEDVRVVGGLLVSLCLLSWGVVVAFFVQMLLHFCSICV